MASIFQFVEDKIIKHKVVTDLSMKKVNSYYMLFHIYILFLSIIDYQEKSYDSNSLSLAKLYKMELK